MSNASLNVTYAMVSQSIGFHTYSSNMGTKTASDFYGDNSLVTFHGNGNATSSGNGIFYEMFHTTNAIGMNPELWSDCAFTYSVSNDGGITIPNSPYGG